MRYLLLLPLFALPLSVPAAAAPKAEASARDPDSVRCRAIKELESRIPKRICKTNAEWERQEAEAREAMATRNRNSQCSGTVC